MYITCKIPSTLNTLNDIQRQMVIEEWTFKYTCIYQKRKRKKKKICTFQNFFFLSHDFLEAWIYNFMYVVHVMQECDWVVHQEVILCLGLHFEQVGTLKDILMLELTVCFFFFFLETLKFYFTQKGKKRNPQRSHKIWELSRIHQNKKAYKNTTLQ